MVASVDRIAKTTGTDPDAWRPLIMSLHRFYGPH
jgi:hypothetical protein